MFFKKRNIVERQWKITKKCLNLILESSKSIYPREFGGLLRIDEEDKNTISEIILLPGTVSGNSHAIFRLNMMPIDFSIVGTVHSHPSSIPFPSDADLHLFRKHGKIHIIAASPFNYESWNAFDYQGSQIDIKTI